MIVTKHQVVSRFAETVMLSISAILDLAIAFASYDNGKKRSVANEQLKISRQIADVNAALLSALKDAETGQRGF